MLVEIKCIKSRLRTLNKQAKIFFRIIPIYFLIWSSTKNLFHTLIWRQSSRTYFVTVTVFPHKGILSLMDLLSSLGISIFNKHFLFFINCVFWTPVFFSEILYCSFCNSYNQGYFLDQEQRLEKLYKSL